MPMGESQNSRCWGYRGAVAGPNGECENMSGENCRLGNMFGEGCMTREGVSGGGGGPITDR